MSVEPAGCFPRCSVPGVLLPSLCLDGRRLPVGLSGVDPLVVAPHVPPCAAEGPGEGPGRTSGRSGEGESTAGPALPLLSTLAWCGRGVLIHPTCSCCSPTTSWYIPEVLSDVSSHDFHLLVTSNYLEFEQF